MHRDDRRLVRKYIDGGHVPLAKLQEIVEAEFSLPRYDKITLQGEQVLLFLDELRPEGTVGRHSPRKKSSGR